MLLEGLEKIDLLVSGNAPLASKESALEECQTLCKFRVLPKALFEFMTSNNEVVMSTKQHVPKFQEVHLE